VILFNLGVTASKPFLAISGDQDITGYSAASMATAINGAPKAAYAYFHNPVGMGSLKGHLVLMMSPERVTDLTVNWWNMFFKGDMAAHDFFVGTSCGACGHATDYNYGEHGL
jgi:hypothetical protein